MFIVSVSLLCLGFSGLASQVEAPTILLVGDSLSAGYGIALEDSWVVKLQRKLLDEDYPYRIVNASISGDTTRGALERLPKVLKQHRPAIVVVELGGNDGLRGFALGEIRRNLLQIVKLSHQAGAIVLIIEIRLPPNYGPTYTARLEQIYRDAAAAAGTELAPFLLEGVAGHPDLMQLDGIHPRAEAQTIILDNVWLSLRSLLAPRSRDTKG